MYFACPIYTTPEWIALEKKLGFDQAIQLFLYNKYEVPSLEEIEAIGVIDNSYPQDTQELTNLLVSTSLFRHKEGNLVITKGKDSTRNLSKAREIIAKINKETPGRITLQRDRYNSTIVIIHDQLPLFDLPSNNTNTLLLPGFKSFYQQNQAIDVISTVVLKFYEEHEKTAIKKPNFKESIKQVKTVFTEAREELPIEIYTTVLNNLDELSLLVRNKLENLKLIGRLKLEGTDLKRSVDTTEDSDDESKSEAIGESGEDEWVFRYDSKDNALAEIKKFLAFIPVTNYDEKKGIYTLTESIIPQQPVYMTYDDVHRQLKAVLAGLDNTWEEVERELEANQIGKPFIRTVLNAIKSYKGDKERLLRQFVSTMSSSYSGFKTVLIKNRFDREGNIIGKYFNTIDTDRGSVEKLIESKWKGNFRRSKLVEEKDGDLVINKDESKKFITKLNKAKEIPTEENIKELLNDLGITISDSTLLQLVNGKIGKNKLDIAQQFISKSGIFYTVNLRLTGKEATKEVTTEEEEEDKQLPNDPTINNPGLTSLARVESYNTENYYSDTFKDGEGNTVCSYTFNKFLTKEFNKLLKDENYVKELLDITFNKPILKGEKPIYESWLTLLNDERTKNIFKTVLNISPLDTLKVSGINTADSGEGIKLKAMSELDLEVSKIALMQNSGQRKKGLGTDHPEGARVIKYLLTVPDKTTSYVIQGTGQEVKLFFDGRTNTYSIDSNTKDALYSIAASEHNRILSQQARKSDNKEYDQGAKFFYFFPSLNDIKELYNEDNTIKLPTTKLEDGRTVEQVIRAEILKIINKDIQETIQKWEDLGVADKERLLLVDSNYEYNVLRPQAENHPYPELFKITIAAADFVINSTLAKFNVHQIFIDDPAVYFKKDVETTWENISKRLTNLIAPAKEGLVDETNKKFLSIKLADRKTNALNYAQLEARLNKLYDERGVENPYKDITGTDAQEYVTLKEHIKVLYMYGELSTKLYNEILKGIEEKGDELVLTKEQLDEILFISMKPVYSSRIVSKEDDTIYREYIKSSAFPLLPQLTKGLELDKLRKAMEKLEKGNLSTRAVFDTGTKLGGKGSIHIWKEDGTIKDNLDLAPYSVILDRSNFGIQQENPYDEEKDDTIRSTQVLKLLFDSLDNIKGFRYLNKTYGGKELKNIYTELHQKLYEKGLAELEGRVLEHDGTNRLNMYETIKLLRNEGIKRKYTPAQISFLVTNLATTDFAIPFWAHTNNDKEQAMLTSMWTNKVLKQKMPGSSNILVSEEGFQGKGLGILYIGKDIIQTLDKENSDILNEELSKENKTKLIKINTTDPTDNTNTLEEIGAEEAVRDIKKQYNRLEGLLKCLNS